MLMKQSKQLKSYNKNQDEGNSLNHLNNNSSQKWDHLLLLMKTSMDNKGSCDAQINIFSSNIKSITNNLSICNHINIFFIPTISFQVAGDSRILTNIMERKNCNIPWIPDTTNSTANS